MEPENPGNIGAIARAMANFNLTRLVIVNPKCDALSKPALDRARHAQRILKTAKVCDKSCLKNFDYLIATTAILGTDYNIPRSPITPKQLAEKLVNVSGNIALLIGREGSGLTNREILGCDFVVTIPASKRYPTLNVSHAAVILFYEIFRAIGKNKSNSHIITATKKEKKVLLQKINNILQKMEFATPEKKETQKKVWKRIIGKSFLTKREAFALLGFFRKLEKKK
jgi:TrmH family RNA methyltransferase